MINVLAIPLPEELQEKRAKGFTVQGRGSNPKLFVVGVFLRNKEVKVSFNREPGEGDTVFVSVGFQFADYTATFERDLKFTAGRWQRR